MFDADKTIMIGLPLPYGEKTMTIKQSLTMEATKTLVHVHAFVSSRLGYCNSVLAGVSGQLLHRL